MIQGQLRAVFQAIVEGKVPWGRACKHGADARRVGFLHIRVRGIFGLQRQAIGNIIGNAAKRGKITTEPAVVSRDAALSQQFCWSVAGGAERFVAAHAPPAQTTRQMQTLTKCLAGYDIFAAIQARPDEILQADGDSGQVPCFFQNLVADVKAAVIIAGIGPRRHIEMVDRRIPEGRRNLWQNLKGDRRAGIAAKMRKGCRQGRIRRHFGRGHIDHPRGAIKVKERHILCQCRSRHQQRSQCADLYGSGFADA